ncbi:MAG: signal peptidase [Deferribacteres bacterium]|jgi:signal peptidase II|nr:signal peptidase [Deferribacteres bacterium]
MKKYLPIIFILVLIDQVTKFYIKHVFDLYETKEIIPGFFNLTFVLNPGAAFGFLAKLNESFRQIFFIIVTIIAIIIVIYLMYKEMQHKLRAFSYALILSGAIGNFIDRIYLGSVVDFLDFYIKNYHWPAFNIADSCITVGIILLILDMIINKKGAQDANQT